ncbi:TonB-dependent receptor [Hymenobacter weizhouensis]|uniref:TonB-dependent receptor n=1 Tax=Hymenobacter sp. YIM 151500-1 TaxID=2987689 RepID=UPI0022279BFD|nr:TonB-dependent receptor [Hymenobacter sp. YIM 151500-1]UYZ63010.1 TonB-dependent receptor [Hymenobacter sp. YIM 151500-1]
MKQVLFTGAALLVLPLAAWAQGPVSGTLRDARSGAPLPGATVLLDGSTATATAPDGSFALPAVPAGSHVLRVTFVGYEPLVRLVQGQPTAQELALTLQEASVLTGEALVTASRANERTATAYANLSKEDLAKRNFGQDIPYLLDQTPSVVTSSDAGAGIGYTGLRIRGTDIAGINVTINGVPLNDAESHGAFFVNLPDLASSTTSLQVQRGVGTSQNGGAAFGASLNLSTLETRREAYAETQNTYGSFNTWRNNVQFGTGLLGGRFSVDGRLSRIASDGYIDRASSDLKSYYLAAGYQQKNTLLKFITFSGREKTYQAWNGVPQDSLQTNRRYNEFTYDNQTDNYQQNHYQLHLTQGLGPDWNLASALHLTRGFGYYEEFRAADKLADYGLQNVALGDTTIRRTDLVRRKWLDNYFFGGTFALNYQPRQHERLQATLGGAWNRYLGDHFGEVIWARYASNGFIRHRYYFNDAEKTDFNAYARATWQATGRLGLFGDAQVRTIRYTINGLDDDQRDVTTRARYTFFNPKAGATFALAEGQQLYASFAVGQREPVRADFTDRPATDRPRAERLHDLEAGYRLQQTGTTLLGQNTSLRLEANYFYMNYRNQLVATGQLNDVGTPLRTNIPSSYRTGLELTAAAGWADWLSVSSTLTLSRNQLRNFREVVYIYNDDYDLVGQRELEYRNATISFSPSVVSASTVEAQPLKGLRTALLLKTVSRQFLDNSASAERSLPAYQVLDLRLRYTLRPSWLQEIELGLLMNNLLNQEYESNGYTFGNFDTAGRRLSYNYYYPQATRNFLVSVGLKL